ncbi:Fpg/Nei family DNA glycosylase [Actinomyces vulturis]|uniref:Fpg/Nei family DNA glycosylase n=1 Tax=Actinomyces vulturis TaxID=1857645 RepID=UPI00082D0115|nr:zinc finger domain-containing protein [Actinomyces vulturis]
MPEGDVLHRLAQALDELFGPSRHSQYHEKPAPVHVSSPQGRFAAGAELIDSNYLTVTQAHGKHLFLGFTPEPWDIRKGFVLPSQENFDESDLTWLHIHLGLYGSWVFDGDSSFIAPHSIGAPRRRFGEGGEKAIGSDGKPLSVPEIQAGSSQHHESAETDAAASETWNAPQPRGQVRVRFESEHGVADLSGPNRCHIVTTDEKQAIHRRLGPDPLDPGSDPYAFVDAVRSSSRTIAQLLMDQSVIAGVGNIYRAESLLRAPISPHRQGKNISEARLKRLWDDLVGLMNHGVDVGRIETIESEHIPDPLPPDDAAAARYYVYHRTGRACLLCGTIVQSAQVDGRTLYWCPGCQNR